MPLCCDMVEVCLQPGWLEVVMVQSLLDTTGGLTVVSTLGPQQTLLRFTHAMKTQHVEDYWSLCFLFCWEIFLFILVLDVLVFFFSCTCVPHSWSALGGQQRALDPLGLELQLAVSHHVGAGDQIWVFCKSSFQLLSHHLPIPCWMIFILKNTMRVYSE